MNILFSRHHLIRVYTIGTSVGASSHVHPVMILVPMVTYSLDYWTIIIGHIMQLHVVWKSVHGNNI